MRRSLGDVSPRCRSRRGPGASRPLVATCCRARAPVGRRLSRGRCRHSSASPGAAAPAALRSLAGLRSRCLRCRGPRRPLSDFVGQQRRQQRRQHRRYAERSNALERARPAHGARAPAHVCPLLSPLRRPIRPLLVLAGAGDASAPRRVRGVRIRPAAAGIDVRGGADTPLSHSGACAWRAAAMPAAAVPAVGAPIAGARTTARRPARRRDCCRRVCSCALALPHPVT